MRHFLSALAAAGLAVAAGTALPAAAQDAQRISIELNRLEPQGGNCRVWMVARNPTSEAIDPLRLDLLMFGKDGVIARRLALDIGPLPETKTQARIFDLAGQACDSIGSVLLNDVLACGPTPEGRAACLPRIALSSRVSGVSFDK
ncbi:Tat pathway signal protein [Pseudoroseomonas ludipueritiae]|uniref:Tat pathway signal protein n=1 Tax=Pseudoroseomonas ludipueritiae TaxID=198093 RepID=A0ABR7RCN7_9PROT|nr:Tat pathway signal protein [Pseudoroseomonas ludipueritiae]MBC9179406.1 Tat pathway signal protein [Pseudoroseomonas ludipueritiae]MCG7360500.1 Tat pathway signal protein [Roseomonas sp. ACRSG]